MALFLDGSFSNGLDPFGLYVALVVRHWAGCEGGMGKVVQSVIQLPSDFASDHRAIAVVRFIKHFRMHQNLSEKQSKVCCCNFLAKTTLSCSYNLTLSENKLVKCARCAVDRFA
jgi:hypothetical protein